MNSTIMPSPSSATVSTDTASPAPATATAPAPAKPKGGRPSDYSSRTVDVLCGIIREKGISDSAAASMACLHPSTVSRWKREYPDLVIMLRSARELFRTRHLATILNKASAGEAGSWRAAAWLLERTFPEDYSPRARERALFREQFDAACASEEEGEVFEFPDRPMRDDLEAGSPAQSTPLQNVKNSGAPANEPPSAEMLAVGSALQNVKNSPLTGQVRPAVITTR